VERGTIRRAGWGPRALAREDFQKLEHSTSKKKIGKGKGRGTWGGGGTRLLFLDFGDPPKGAGTGESASKKKKDGGGKIRNQNRRLHFPVASRSF